MLNVLILSVIRLNVVMLNVVGPLPPLTLKINLTIRTENNEKKGKGII